jgi:hypothetical protein
MGGYTRESGNSFRVRKNFADERQDHCLIILSAGRAPHFERWINIGFFSWKNKPRFTAADIS